MTQDIAVLIERSDVVEDTATTLTSVIAKNSLRLVPCRPSKSNITRFVHGPAVSMVLIGPGVKQPVAMARFAFQASPAVQIIFLSDGAEAEKKLQRELALAPMIGTN